MSAIWNSCKPMIPIVGKAKAAILKIPDVIIKPVAEEIAQDAAKNAPKKTGALRRGITVVKIADGYMVYGKESYTVYQEEGTRYFRGKFFMKNAITRGLPKLVDLPIQKIFGIG